MTAEREWDVEAISDASEFTHIVGFADVIAHRREDLVARAAAFLQGMDGVEQAIHEDREQILVSAPRIFTGQIQHEFGAWWDEARKSDPPWAELLKRHSSAAQAVLKRLGFKKRTHTFNRQTSEDVWHVIELMRVRDDEARIDIGIYVEGVDALEGRDQPRPNWIAEPACQIRDPLDGRHHFALSDDPAVTAQLLETEIVPGLERLKTRSQLRTASEDGKRELGMGRPAQRAIAALAVLDGDLDVAQRIMQETFEGAGRQGRNHIHKVAERMGLAPLTTGKDPTLSIQDEEVLATWIAGHEARIDQLQALIDAHPVPQRRLSLIGKTGGVDVRGGRETLPGLWRWLLRGAAEADQLIVGPAPLETRYAGYSVDKPTPGRAALAELLACYMFEVVAREVADVVWDLDASGVVALFGKTTSKLISRGLQLVSWAVDPPASVADPEQANMLERRIDWLVKQLR